MFFPDQVVLSSIRQCNVLGKDKIPFLILIDFEMEKPVILPLEKIDNSNIRYKFNQIKNYEVRHAGERKDLMFEKFPMPYEKYIKSFDMVKSEILYGNSFLVNLTFPTRIQTNYNLLQLFNISRSKYKLYYENKFIVFSPETFVQIKDGKIYAHPMKGTIDAATPDAEEKLLADQKEIAEHYTIVDLIRNDLGIVSENVEVRKFRYLDLIKTLDKSLYQTSSEIEGQLPPDYTEHIGDIIFSLLPAGSVSGAPKKKTCEIIRQAEGRKRGYYTGVMGLFDGENFDSAVMIRFIERNGKSLYFRSGCGITAMSDCLSEYLEMTDKVYVPVG